MTSNCDDVTITLHGATVLRLSACVQPGEVLVVMGESGSGKSSLLAFLAARWARRSRPAAACGSTGATSPRCRPRRAASACCSRTTCCSRT